jgi:hypothetical protein
MPLVLDRVMQFVAEFAYVRNTKRSHRCHPDVHFLAAEEAKRLARTVGPGQGLQQISRAWTGDGQNPVVGRDIVELNRAVLRQMSFDPGEVVVLGSGGRDDVIVIIAQLRHREVALDSALVRAHLRKRHAAQRFRELVGTQVVEEFCSAGSGHLVLGEARLVEYADPLAHGAALRNDGIVPVAAVK